MKGKRYIGHDPQHPGLFVKRIEWVPDQTDTSDQTVFNIRCECGFTGKSKPKEGLLGCPKCKYVGKLPTISQVKVIVDDKKPKPKQSKKAKTIKSEKIESD